MKKNTILRSITISCTLPFMVMPLYSCVSNTSTKVETEQNDINVNETKNGTVGLSQHVSIETSLDLSDPYTIFFTRNDYSFDDHSEQPLTMGLCLDCDGSNIRVNGIESILVLNSFVSREYSYLRAGTDFNNFRHEGHVLLFDITPSGQNQILYLLRNPNPNVTAKLQIKPKVGGIKYDIDMKIEGVQFKTELGVVDSEYDSYVMHWDVYKGKGIQSAQWYYKSQKSKVFDCLIDPCDNIHIYREHGLRFHDDIVLLLHLQGVLTPECDGRFENDPWDNLYYWMNFFNGNGDKLAAVYANEREEQEKGFNKDWLLGKKRHVLWDGISHEVMVVAVHRFLLSNRGNQMILLPWEGDISNDTATLTFQFTNLLTDHNYNLVKKMFSDVPVFDEDYSNWVRETYGSHYAPSDLRKFFTSKDFLKKFDPQVLKYVKPTVHQHWTHVNWDLGLTESYTAWIGDKFWVPTPRQIGGEELGYYGHTETLYWTELYYYDPFLKNYDGRVMFPYWEKQLGNKGTIGELPERIYTSVPREGETGMPYRYWLSSPSKWGSGFFKTEDDVLIEPTTGKMGHCDMDNKLALLPCFSI